MAAAGGAASSDLTAAIRMSFSVTTVRFQHPIWQRSMVPTHSSTCPSMAFHSTLSIVHSSHKTSLQPAPQNPRRDTILNEVAARLAASATRSLAASSSLRERDPRPVPRRSANGARSRRRSCRPCVSLGLRHTHVWRVFFTSTIVSTASTLETGASSATYELSEGPRRPTTRRSRQRAEPSKVTCVLGTAGYANFVGSFSSSYTSGFRVFLRFGNESRECPRTRSEQVTRATISDHSRSSKASRDSSARHSQNPTEFKTESGKACAFHRDLPRLNVDHDALCVRLRPPIGLRFACRFLTRIYGTFSSLRFGHKSSNASRARVPWRFQTTLDRRSGSWDSRVLYFRISNRNL